MIARELLDGILTLRLAHGKANALDLELVDALLAELDTTDEARAVVLTGTGTIFSAGVDLFRLVDAGPDYVSRFFWKFRDVVRRLFTLPKPVIAAVNGHAVAGGCILALAADSRIMADGKGRFGLPELAVGLPFPSAALEAVRFAVPRRRVQSMVYGAETVLPADALREGWVDEVLAPDTLGPRALELARKYAAIPADTFRITKQCLRAEAAGRMEDCVTADAEALAVWQAPEAHARIRAYLARVVGR